MLLETPALNLEDLNELKDISEIYKRCEHDRTPILYYMDNNIDTVTKRDVFTLLPQRNLTNFLIHCTFTMLQRNFQSHKPDEIVFLAEFLPIKFPDNITSIDKSKINRGKNLQLEKIQLIIILVTYPGGMSQRERGHFAIIGVNFKDHKITYYDSDGFDGRKALIWTKLWIEEVYREYTTNTVTPTWSMHTAFSNLNRPQSDGFNCGMFAILFAESLALNKDIRLITQEKCDQARWILFKYILKLAKVYKRDQRFFKTMFFRKSVKEAPESYKKYFPRVGSPCTLNSKLYVVHGIGTIDGKYFYQLLRSVGDAINLEDEAEVEKNSIYVSIDTMDENNFK